MAISDFASGVSEESARHCLKCNSAISHKPSASASSPFCRNPAASWAYSAGCPSRIRENSGHNFIGLAEAKRWKEPLPARMLENPRSSGGAKQPVARIAKAGQNEAEVVQAAV